MLGRTRPLVGIARMPFTPNITKRYFLGALFRAARLGSVALVGSAVGSAAYINYKIAEVGSSASESLSNMKDYAQSVLDGISWPSADPSEKGNSQSQQGPQNQANGGQNQNHSNPNSGQNGQNSDPGAGAGGAGPGAGAVAAFVYEDDDTMANLTRKMIEIRNLLLQIENSELQLPSIVVIGSQSSGKSSVLEALVGHEFLPKGLNMVTRRPIELTLVRTPEAEYCEFPGLGLHNLTDFAQVQRTLLELNNAVPAEQVVSEDPIHLTMYSPRVPDLTLVDLPGYIQVVALDQPLELRERIATLCTKYIKAPNIILAISAADVDLANSTALQASRRVDPEGLRTIGVVTKMDLVDPARGRAILTNRDYPLRSGYVGVVTKMPRHSSSNAAILEPIMKREHAFFSEIQEYSDLSVGMGQLRTRLVSLLEQSMTTSLVPTMTAIRKELDECAYQFKVEFNDRVLTPQSFIANSLDSLKASFRDLTAEFTRDDVRVLIRRNLDQRVLDILAESYWNSPLPDSKPGLPLADLTSPKPDLPLWNVKVDASSASLTKLGVGRMSTNLLVEAILERMKHVAESTPFRSQPLALTTIEEATLSILKSRTSSTADQVENSIKPYKYEVELDNREWQASRDHMHLLLKAELHQCEQALVAIRSAVGAHNLKQAMSQIEALRRQHTATLDPLSFSPQLLDKAREALFLRDRAEIIRMRLLAIRSKACASSDSKAICPEVFLGALADKLTSTAVVFLNFELLSDFYYSFPRELDSRFNKLTEAEVEQLATQDPRIKQHIDLQRRKDMFELAMSKIQAVSEMHQQRER